jgi:hypothetical protein
MVTAFADAPFSTPAFEALLLSGGELVRNAGPLVKGSNLCHGTGGNAYSSSTSGLATPFGLDVRGLSAWLQSIKSVELALRSGEGATRSGPEIWASRCIFGIASTPNRCFEH